MSSPDEKDATDAPIWFTAAESHAWAQGYNAALAEVRQSTPPVQVDREAISKALDPNPWVWDGHSKTDQMRLDTEMFRKGAPRGVMASMNYVFQPRPGYSQIEEDYR